MTLCAVADIAAAEELQSELRTWKSKSGKTSTVARLWKLTHESGEVRVHLMKEDGNSFSMPLKSLSPTDSIYVETVRKTRRAALNHAIATNAEQKTLEFLAGELRLVDPPSVPAQIGLASQANRGDSPGEPRGFRGLDWGSPVAPGMVLKSESQAKELRTYARTGDALEIAGHKLKEITYDYHNGKLVAVSIEAFGKDVIEVVKANFGPLERKFGNGMGELPGWPFHFQTGVPFSSHDMYYKLGRTTVICVFELETPFGALTGIEFIEIAEAKRRSEIRKRLVMGKPGDF